MPDPSVLVPLPVAVPFAAAAALGAGSSFLPKRAACTLSLLTSLAVVVIAGALACATASHPLVYWFGGWKPDAHHFPWGISWVVDPLSAGAAAFVALLVSLAFLFSWGHFRTVKTLYHVLMLIFLAAMCGLCLSGDLFNLFVWFELMTASAIALCGYKCSETGPLQGALNLAVTNTIGAFITLTGIAYLYALTGSLNFAGISAALAAHPPAPAFLAAAFLFTITGFLVKAAAYPFHFWLADAHAVAPTPVSMLFSGIMVQLGLYAVARLIFGLFLPAMGPFWHAAQRILLILGVATMLIGSLECFVQHHLKRMLAFSTIAHTGVLLSALALATPVSVTGIAIYVVGHGLLKASLFAGAGIVLHRFGSLDEHTLHGAGRRDWPIGVIMLIAAWGLAGLPPFGPFAADRYLEAARRQAGLHYGTYFATFAAAVTAATVARLTVRIFFGWGSRASPPHNSPRREERETDSDYGRVPVHMWLAAALALGLAAVPGFVSGRFGALEGYARAWAGTHLYSASVLTGAQVSYPAPAPLPPISWIPALAAGGLAVLLALLILLPITTQPSRRVFGLWDVFHDFQSGRVGDYVAWLAAGVAVLGSVLVLTV